MCNLDPSGSVQAPQSGPTGTEPAPTATGVIPFPATPVTTSCEQEILPQSGDMCSTGSQMNIQCCYSVDERNGIPAPADYAWICNCVGNVYICNEGTTSSCTSIIRPTGGSSTPVPPVVTAVPAPAPADMPILGGVTTPPVSMEMGGTGCPAGLSDFEDGSSCDGLVPDDKASKGCGYEEIVGSPPISSEKIACECVKANPVWACRSLGLTPIAAPNECPPQDSPPANGDSCAGLLVMENSAQTCMFSRRFSTSSELETFNCECSNAAGSTVDLWSCDGSFMPVVAPSLMPAGQIQPSTTIPVPAAPTATTATTPTECGTFPGDVPHVQVYYP